MQLCEAKYRPWDERRKKGCGCARRHVPEKRKASLADNRAKNAALSVQTAFFAQNSLAMLHRVCAKTCRTKRPPKAAMSQRPRPKTLFAGRLAKKPRFPANPDALALPGSCFSAFCLFLPGRKPVCGTVPSMCPLFFRFLFCNPVCNGVQREHNKKLNNGLPILHKVPPKRDYGRYFCIMAEKGGTSHGA